MWIVHLLATGLKTLVGRVPHPDGKFLILLAKKWGDVEGESSISSLVTTHLDVIDPDVCFPVHRTEIEKHFFILPSSRNFESSLVPKLIGNSNFFLNTRET